MALKVNERSEAVEDLAKDWDMLTALMRGTRAMREGNTAYLPKWPNEDADSYDARLATATLFPAYRRTVGVMAGKPFAKALTLSDGTPASLVTWAEDIDRQGVSLHVFAAEMFAQTVAGGLAGVLVEMPDTRPRDDRGRPVQTPTVRTVAQVEAQGIRPYWVRVLKEQILGWQSAVIDGATQLTQLRLMESVEVPDGPFGTKSIEQVRVLYPGRWETWRRPGDGKEFVKFDEGRTTLRQIPFVPFYGQRDGFMIGRPPLIDLAWLNVKHWQSQSDQDTIEHVARVPIMVTIGAEDGTAITVGAKSAIKLPLGADMKFVEHSGSSIGAGAESLARLEEQMIQTGAELLVKKPGDRSATESANDAEGNKSDLQRLVENFEDSLDMALQYTADFARLGSGGNAELFKDFGAATLTDASAQLILTMQQGGLITKATAINEQKRRGVLSAEVDADEELEQVEAEGPPPGSLGQDDAPFGQGEAE